MNRILLTGGTGFVGTMLTEVLLAQGYHLRLAVRKSSALKPRAGLEVCQVHSLDAHTDWTHALQDIDTVIHLAGRVHVMRENVADPLSEFRKVNVDGTARLVEMAGRAGVRRIVYLSSVKVNGEGKDCAYTEADQSEPADAYGVSKCEAELALRALSAQSAMEYAIVRTPLVYGPGVKANFLQMLNMVNAGIPLPFASVKNQRSVIFLGNLVDALMLVAKHPAAAGQTYLVKDAVDLSSAELIRKVAQAFEKPARLLPFPPALLRCLGLMAGKKAMIDRLLGSLTVSSAKISHELNWIPPYSTEQGLKKTIEWYKHEKA